MSGHFILKGITTSDLTTAQATGANWSALQHGNVGWTVASRLVLSTALGGGAIGTRAGLPPHRYLEFNFNNARSNEIDKYLAVAGWADTLVQPNSAGLGLTALTHNAAASLAQGNVNQALSQQFNSGTLTIEIYYIAGYEMS